MPSPIRSGRTNFVGYRRSSDLDLASGGVVTGSNTNRVFRANADGTWSSYRPGRSINGFATMTRARAGTDETAARGSGNVYLLDAAANFSVEDAVPIATVLEGSASAPSSAADDVAYVHVISGFDRIPNFALRSGTTVNSAASGNWSSGATWSGGSAPAAGTIVRVRSGHTVTIDGALSNKFLVVSVENGGTLQHSVSANTLLRTRELLVRENGTYTIGTPAAPVPNGTTARLVITDVALDTTADASNFDPNQYGNGLIVLGVFTACGFDRGARFVRSSHERSAGATTITLASTPSNWQSGDALYIPDTRQLPFSSVWSTYTTVALWTAAARWEYRTISSRAGAVITLNSALTYDHLGGRDDAGTLTHLWHVFNRTSNVSVESENPAGTRGHCLFTAHARIDLRHVAFKDLGRTTGEPLDRTGSFDGSGVPGHIGTNQIGRYPVHFHHCGGREPISYDGEDYQFVVVGCVVDGGTSEHNFKWGVTVHGSHWGLVRNNLAHNVFGAGFVAEDGSETLTHFDANASARMPGRGGREQDDEDATGFARNGAGHWMRTGLSRWTGNVATNCFAYGWVINGIYADPLKLPVYPGQHMHDGALSGGVILNAPNRAGLLDFDGFEVYGFTGNAGTIWWLGATSGTPDYSTHRGVLKNLTAWNIVQFGVYMYPVCNLTIDGYTLRYDPSPLADPGEAPFSTGIYGGDYEQYAVITKNCDISGPYFGMEQTPFAEGWMQFINNKVRAVQCFMVRSPGSPGSAPGGVYQKPRVCWLEGNDLAITSASYHFSLTPLEVYHNYQSYGGTGNTVVQHDVYVMSRGGSPGANYRLYSSPWQRPGQTCPANSGLQVGCPVAGLTNQQAHDQYQPYDPDVGADTPLKPSPDAGTPGLCLFGTLTPAVYTNPSWTNADVETL